MREPSPRVSFGGTFYPSEAAAEEARSRVEDPAREWARVHAQEVGDRPSLVTVWGVSDQDWEF
jgi:hypothetical protein